MDSSFTRRNPSGWSIFLGIVLILAGLLAIALPFLAGIAAGIWFGWLVLFAGVTHLIYAWAERGAGNILLQILVGIVYLVAAFFMLSNPVSNVLALTLVLALYIAVEGIFEMGIFFQRRHLAGTSWFLIDGIISLAVAGLIWFHWPSSSLWAIGTLLGVSLVMSGMARFVMPMRRRRVLVSF